VSLWQQLFVIFTSAVLAPSAVNIIKAVVEKVFEKFLWPKLNLESTPTNYPVPLINETQSLRKELDIVREARLRDQQKLTVALDILEDVCKSGKHIIEACKSRMDTEGNAAIKTFVEDFDRGAELFDDIYRYMALHREK
jgi:hypothetical protein